MIDNTYNYDNQYFRMIAVSLAKTLSRSINWINYFENKKIRVLVPFYLSLAGDERFLLDAFADDIVDKRVEMNTDQIPRGVITLNSFVTNSDEFANPNIYLSKKTKLNGEYRKIVSKTKAIPVTFNFDVSIVLDSELDTYKVSEKILKVFFNYKFFNIEYYGMKIDAVLSLPDDKTIEIVRETNLTTERKKKVNFPLTVKSYYPDFYIDTDEYEICDNDSEINWENLGMIPPSEREDIPNYKRVYWSNYIFGEGRKPDDDDELRENTPKENF